MIILDTNVVSELIRSDPNIRVLAWVRSVLPTELFTTAITRTEIFYGVELLPEGRRKNRLRDAAEAVFSTYFADGVVPFDESAADGYARLRAHRRRIGRLVAPFDIQIAAIARSHGAAVATRNVSDFTDCGIQLIDPWQA